MDQQLIVAGFHRSGTSFTAQLLHEAGLFVGDDLLGADPSNPYGHFEDRIPFGIHKAILADNGTDWRIRNVRPFRVGADRWEELHDFVTDRRSRHRLWGFKDPRVCFFLGMWKHLLPDVRILVVFRDYRDAVWSLRRRHSRNLLREQGDPQVHLSIVRDPEFALEMWTAYNEALLAAISAHRRDTFVLPLDAVQQGFPLIRTLNQKFGLGLSAVDAAHVYDPGATVVEARPLPVPDLVGVRRAERTLTALWNASNL